VLFVYGAYGYKLHPQFNPAEVSLLDRGVVLAVAHVRGGGELGAAWHAAGGCMWLLTGAGAGMGCCVILLHCLMYCQHCRDHNASAGDVRKG
jgi:hypothetical protein